MWRVDELRITGMGVARGRQVGSLLPTSDDLEDEYERNLISPAARHHARERVAASKAHGSALTILADRLLNNMLSSQPMCFNLLSDLGELVSAGDREAVAALQLMFPEAGIRSAQRITAQQRLQGLAAFGERDLRTGRRALGHRFGQCLCPA